MRREFAEESFLPPVLVQWTFFASPHAGFTLALMDVICFHWPIGPAQISGATENDWRTIVEVRPSLASEMGVPRPAVMDSKLFHSVCASPPLVETVAMPALPSTFSVKRSLSAAVQERPV